MLGFTKLIVLCLSLCSVVFLSPVLIAETTNQTTPKYVAGELLIKYRAGTTPAAAASLENKMGAKRQRQFHSQQQKSELGRWVCLSLKPGMSVQQAMQILSQNPNIEHVEPNYIGTSQRIPNDPAFSLQWSLHSTGQNAALPDADIDAPEAWDLPQGNKKIVVAVMDTDVDIAHEDLLANLWVNEGEIPNNFIDDDANGYIDDVNGYDFAYGDADPRGPFGHGTHVAGIIAAVGNNGKGVAGIGLNTRIMAIRHLDDNDNYTITNVVAGIQYAINNGANIINASWGVSGNSLLLSDALNDANTANVLFVAAAGNGLNGIGFDIETSPFYPASYTHPNIISVAATGYEDSISPFSNFGANSVDLGAPGDRIYSTLNGNTYGYKSGTSMATPHVSGAAAVVWANNPGMSVSALKARILNNVEPLSSLVGVTVSGGRLNLFAALTKSGSSAAAPINPAGPNRSTVSSGASAGGSVSICLYLGLSLPLLMRRRRLH